jgi:transcriptional regulator with XRE-family HTH domain
VGKDWQAVSDAIKARLAELGMTQADLAHRAGVALETVRELQHNLRPRRRSPRTLSAVSTALDWPEDRLAVLAAGGDPDSDHALSDPVLSELEAVHAVLDGINSRLEAIERRLEERL